MRFFPVAAALSVALAVTASVGHSAPRQTDPRAAALVAAGDAQLNAGEVEKATDAYEAALAIDPGSSGVYIRLAIAARRTGMQGKAIRYYRAALMREPRNMAAIAGEGAALAEKGALEKARQNLARLDSICGTDCSERDKLARIIAMHGKETTLRAEAVAPDTQVTQN